VRSERTAEPVEVAVSSAAAVAGGVRRRRVEMAADVRVPLQLHDAGRRHQAGRGQNVQKLRARHEHQGVPSAERRE